MAEHFEPNTVLWAFYIYDVLIVDKAAYLSTIFLTELLLSNLRSIIVTSGF